MKPTPSPSAPIPSSPLCPPSFAPIPFLYPLIPSTHGHHSHNFCMARVDLQGTGLATTAGPCSCCPGMRLSCTSQSSTLRRRRARKSSATCPTCRTQMVAGASTLSLSPPCLAQASTTQQCGSSVSAGRTSACSTRATGSSLDRAACASRHGESSGSQC